MSDSKLNPSTPPENGAAAPDGYGGDQIKVLEGLEAVRRRPGMYVGGSDKRAMHHLIAEAADNVADEFLAGFGDTLDVIIHPDKSVEVRDQARGIPVEWNAQMQKSALWVATHVLHAGGKFQQEGSAYTVSGGLHGVGLKGVNALSEKMVVTVHRGGKKYELVTSRGVCLSGLDESDNAICYGDTDEQGTWIRFWPDRRDIFKEEDCEDWDQAMVKERLVRMAHLNPGLKIRLRDLRPGHELDETYVSSGLSEMVQEMVSGQKCLLEAPLSAVQVTEMDGKPVTTVKFALTWTAKGIKTEVAAFGNNVYNPEGGTHAIGLRQAVGFVVGQHVEKYRTQKEKGLEVTQNDILTGMMASVVVYLREPEFVGQTKDSLRSPEARPMVYNFVKEQLAEFLEENPSVAKAIAQKAILAARARVAAQRAREVVQRSSESGLTDNGKLTRCTSKDPAECELFIVEGDSAGGSAKEGRDHVTQAILPLRGKILNVEKATADKVMENAEIAMIIKSLGAGYGDSFDLEKLRYHKVIIMTDADVDGSHIRVLLITLFAQLMPQLIDAGMLYRAQPPLYLLKQKGKKEPIYAYSEEEKDEIMARFGGPDKFERPQRYKGLGEMNADQLWETTMDPARRQLVRLTWGDVDEAMEAIAQCMGDDVSQRRELLDEYRDQVEIDDVA